MRGDGHGDRDGGGSSNDGAGRAPLTAVAERLLRQVAGELPPPPQVDPALLPVAAAGAGRAGGDGGGVGFWLMALRDAAMHPERHRDIVLWEDPNVVIIRDKYPKVQLARILLVGFRNIANNKAAPGPCQIDQAALHWLVLPRLPTLDSVADLTTADLPMVRAMKAAAEARLEQYVVMAFLHTHSFHC